MYVYVVCIGLMVDDGSDGERESEKEKRAACAIAFF